MNGARVIDSRSKLYGKAYWGGVKDEVAGESAVYWAKQLLDEANQMIRDE